MTRIFFWAGDSQGCAYYRCELPAGQLTALGHETLVSTMMPEEWLHASDVIVGQRVCNPGSSIRWQQLARERRVKLVYEIDDDLLNVDKSNGPAWPFFSRPEIRDNIRNNLRVADLVTVTTESLAAAIRQYNSNVVVLPNCIPQWMLELPAPVEVNHRITIGWGGGASHAMDWAEADSEVSRFVARHGLTEMHVMGWYPDELWRRLPEDRRRFTPWIFSLPELYRAIDFNIGLAPLRPHVFNRSKSPIKTLEYAALGIPAIATDTGPYSDFVRHGETGFLIRRPHEWSRYLRQLLDPTVRKEMGTKARTLAAEHTIENNAHLWEKALTQ